jgi:hypothetical protein
MITSETSGLNALQRQIYNTQTKLRGDNDSEYQIYVSVAKSLGWAVKSYEEWLNS